MKELRKQLRHYIAEKFLGWSWSIMPDCEMKNNLTVFIAVEFEKSLNEIINPKK